MANRQFILEIFNNFEWYITLKNFIPLKEMKTKNIYLPNRVNEKGEICMIYCSVFIRRVQGN